MSDLSLNNAGSSSNVNNVNQKQSSGKASMDLAPLNIKMAGDKRIKYGKVYLRSYTFFISGISIPTFYAIFIYLFV